MADYTPEALTAAAVAIHDVDCPDTGCSGPALGHCYKLAKAALDAAVPRILRAWCGATWRLEPVSADPVQVHPAPEEGGTVSGYSAGGEVNWVGTAGLFCHRVRIVRAGKVLGSSDEVTYDLADLATGKILLFAATARELEAMP